MYKGVVCIYPHELVLSSMNGPVGKPKDTFESSALTTTALSDEPASPNATTELTVCDDSGCSLDTLLILTAASGSEHRVLTRASR
jgi:hypothetical protein